MGEQPPEPIRRDEAEALLATRAELGPAYDAELVDSFADRIERAVEARVSQRSGATLDHGTQASLEREAGTRQMILGFVSLGTGIPISAIAAINTEPGLLGLAVAWAGVVGVNVAHALQGRHRR